MNVYAYVNGNPGNWIDPEGLGFWSDNWNIWKNDFLSGNMGNRALSAATAELSMIAGGGEIAFGYITSGFGGFFIAMHGGGNLAGGVGDYLNVFDPCEERDWNFVEKGYRDAADFANFDPNYGSKAFHIVDAAIGGAALMKSVPVKTTARITFPNSSIPLYLEGYKNVPAFKTTGSIIVTNNLGQVIINTSNAANSK